MSRWEFLGELGERVTVVAVALAVAALPLAFLDVKVPAAAVLALLSAQAFTIVSAARALRIAQTKIDMLLIAAGKAPE